MAPFETQTDILRLLKVFDKLEISGLEKDLELVNLEMALAPGQQLVIMKYYHTLKPFKSGLLFQIINH